MPGTAISLALALWGSAAAGAAGTVNTNAAYSVLAGRTAAVRTNFFVYLDADSGFNLGFPSGFFADQPATRAKIQVNSACIDDSSSPSGCSSNPNALDRVRGNVLQISFPQLTASQYAGVNIEEPQGWGADPRGVGYDLSGTSQVVFDARSPDGAQVQFGVGGCVTPFFTLPRQWQSKFVSLSTLQQAEGGTAQCPPDLSNVHILFTVVVDGAHAPAGATVLLDNVRFAPVPTAQLQAVGFPLATATFGVIPLQQPAAGRVPFPPDQVNRSITTAYESSLAILAFLARGSAQDLEDARQIADAFDEALHHDNQGDPLPLAPDGSAGVHNGYSAGDLLLLNDQGAGEGAAGQVRLAGFSARFCAKTGFCLVLDGATGGNDAFAILALLAAYAKLGDVTYLDDARTIAGWIGGNLADTSGSGYGGFYVGYPDEGVPAPKPLTLGKSTENNADIFTALSQLAAVEQGLGNDAAAARWTALAESAGDYVMAMYDSGSGCFSGGSVPVGTTASPGISPTGKQRGNEVINTFLFLDSNTFTTLELAASARYRNQIDWRQPVRCVLGRFGRRVVAAGRPYSGFSIDTKTAVGPTGVAWEFTGQAVVLMDFVDALYGVTTFAKEAALYLAQIAQAQGTAPFGDGSGLVASTMAGGDTLAPLKQCLTTPFQCIPERVGLAATSWAIFAAKGLNPLSPPVAGPPGPQACRTTTPPAISFSFVPPLLSPAAVQGNVAFTANPCIASDYSVALFIHVPGFTGGNYICKPYENAPLTAISNDGSWTAEYATGGMDVNATEIWAFLVKPGFTWPCFTDTLPAVDGSSVFAVESVSR
jgi:hypothetical protein